MTSKPALQDLESKEGFRYSDWSLLKWMVIQRMRATRQITE
jgi:hypothetical protein